MDPNPLVTEAIDAGAELVRRFHEFMPVAAAYWINPSNEGGWSLYIASEEIGDMTIDLGYREVSRLVREMQNPYLDQFQVTLVGTDKPLAQAAIDLVRRYPGRMAIHFGSRHFGGIGVEGAYIYPSPVTSQVP